MARNGGKPFFVWESMVKLASWLTIAGIKFS
jgi:hypothetical protein